MKNNRATPTVYTTKELSRKTWHEFERLFTQGGGWDSCWCMYYQRPRNLPKRETPRTRAERAIRNHQEKKELVDKRRSHGVLVYADGEPVGWCQYGPKEELPRIDNAPTYRDVALKDSSERIWRITCFVVLKEYRRRRVGTVALDAALESIRKKGGGIVEVYPISRWAAGSFGNESTHGTVSMFRRAGFKPITPFWNTRFSSHLLMRKSVRGKTRGENE